MPSRNFSGISSAARFNRFDGIVGFFSALFDTARNWADTELTAMPGYRDRIVHVSLEEEEGGLNLNMPADVVKKLVERGDEAGATVTNPASFDWDEHRKTRFRTMMLMLQQGLGETGFRRPGVYAGFREVVEGWQAAGTSPEPPPLIWWQTAIPASNAVFDLSASWPDFSAEDLTPTPTLRIVPRA